MRAHLPHLTWNAMRIRALRQKVLEMAEKAKSAVLGCFEKLDPFFSTLFLREVIAYIHKKSGYKSLRGYA